jgi:hypothetical protein
MPNHFAKILTTAVLVLSGLAYVRNHGPVKHPHGPRVREVPEITAVSEAKSWRFKDHTFRPIASIKLRAQVLSAERYYADRSSTLSPIDLALGWRALSDTTYLKDLTVSQSSRWYFFKYNEAPLPDSIILEQSKNVHIIPANASVWKLIKRARKNQIINASGSLVQINGPSNFTWISYPTTGGSGEGSCWVMWVEDFRVEG